MFCGCASGNTPVDPGESTAAAPTPFTPANTLVIAGSVSNGGAGVIHAAEQDTDGLIDGVVAGEPVTEMPTTVGYGITVGGVAATGYGGHFRAVQGFRYLGERGAV